MNIVCDGPGPHIPANGILGTADRQVAGMRCTSPSCVPAPDPIAVNRDTIRAKAQQAFTANATFLAAAKPGTAAAQASQAYDQTVRLTREWNALARLVLNLLDDVSDI